MVQLELVKLIQHSVTNSETKIEKGICLYAVDYLFDHILNDQSKTYLVKVGFI